MPRLSNFEFFFPLAITTQMCTANSGDVQLNYVREGAYTVCQPTSRQTCDDKAKSHNSMCTC